MEHIGEKFNKLTIIDLYRKDKRYRKYYLCKNIYLQILYLFWFKINRKFLFSIAFFRFMLIIYNNFLVYARKISWLRVSPFTKGSRRYRTLEQLASFNAARER